MFHVQNVYPECFSYFDLKIWRTTWIKMFLVFVIFLWIDQNWILNIRNYFPVSFIFQSYSCTFIILLKLLSFWDIFTLNFKRKCYKQQDKKCWAEKLNDSFDICVEIRNWLIWLKPKFCFLWLHTFVFLYLEQLLFAS